MARWLDERLLRALAAVPLLLIGAGCGSDRSRSGETGTPAAAAAGSPAGGDGGSAGYDGAGSSGDGGSTEGAGKTGDCESAVELWGVRQAEAPLLTPPGGCPSQRFDQGICQPSPPEPAADGACPGEVVDGVCQPAFEDWPCPQGWAVVPGIHDSEGGSLQIDSIAPFSGCQPIWSRSCAEGQSPRLGSLDCADVSIACPTTDAWHEASIIRSQAPGFDGQIAYVDLAAGTAGDGSRASPFATLSEALAGRGPGDIVALAPGDYAITSSWIQGRLALVGACASDTILRPTSPSESALLALTGNGPRVADVTITGPRPGIGISDATDVSIERVNVTGTTGVGIFAFGTGTQVSIAQAVVRATTVDVNGSAIGISFSGGASAALSDVALIANGETGLGVYDAGTHVAATDLVAADTSSATQSSRVAAGVEVGLGATLRLTRAAVSGNRDVGIYAWGTGTELALTDAHVLENQAVLPRNLGIGLDAFAGAHATLERVTLSKNHGAAIYATDSGTSLHLTDVSISDTRPAIDSDVGSGLHASSGVTVEGNRLVLLRNTGSGAFFGPGVALSLSDVRVIDTTGRSAGSASAIAINGATGTLLRVALARNRDVGLLATGWPADLDVSDLRITDTRVAVGSSGAGVWAADDAGDVQLSVTRGTMANNDFAAVANFGADTSVRLTDVRISNTRAGPGAVLVKPSQDGASGACRVELTRVSLDSNEGTGIFASGSRAQLTLQDVSIENTQSVDELEGGPALGASSGARVTGSRLALSNNVEAGIAMADAGTSLQLTDLLVSGTLAPLEVRAGFGLVAFGGSAVVERAAFVKNVFTAVHVECSDFSFETRRCSSATARDAQVTLRDVIIGETASSPVDGLLGVGLAALGATVDLQRARIFDNRAFGVAAFGASKLGFNDVVIEGTQPAEDGVFAHGIVVREGSELAGERIVVTRNQGSAIVAVERALVNLSELSLTHNESDPVRGVLGRGLEASTGANVSIQRALVCDNHDYGFVAFDAATQLTLDHVRVQDTRFASCVGSSCPDEPGGGGIATLHGAVATLRDFEIRANAVVGLTVFDANVEARDGLITANPIGLNVQGTPLDLDEAFRRVEISGNERDYDIEDLSIPNEDDTDISGFEP